MCNIFGREWLSNAERKVDLDMQNQMKLLSGIK